MKTVLIVAGKLHIGGAEKVCRNIGLYADPARFQVDYLVFGNEIAAYEEELRAKGCRIWHMEPPNASYPRFYENLKRLLREQRYDVVHCHTMFNSGLVLRAAKRCGVPVRIAHSHSIRDAAPRGLVQNTYEKTMRRWILRDATHLIGCGQAAGEWLFGKAAFQKRGLVLLNGIDLERFHFNAEIRQRLRRENGWEACFVIGHAGHLQPVKNQLFLIRLMPELRRRRPDARLVLLGEGSDRAQLEQAVRGLGLEDCVTLPGNVRNVHEYLSAMDVFAFPSLYEGMPLAILEAQANGLPVVLSDRIPGDVKLTDLVSTLPLEDAAAWIDALCEARRGDASQALAQLRASGCDMTASMEKIYRLYLGD